jgi:heterodisulfide reductase subunit B
MRYFYYPGCSLHSTGKEYDISFKKVCNAVGIELKEVNKWICCGASSAHNTSHLLSIALPAESLASVEKEGGSEVVVPCAACFFRLKSTVYEISQNPDLREEVNWVIDYPFKNSVKVLHPLEIFNKEILQKNIKKDLSKFKFVCYYGCLLTRPPKVMQFDICEYPKTMDNILKAVGANTLDWNYKTDCCGAAFSLTKTEIVLKVTKRILEGAREVSADAIVVACPLCHSNLDTRQSDINKVYNTNYEIPVLYFTQVLGLAMGIAPSELAIDKHLTDTNIFLNF